MRRLSPTIRRLSPKTRSLSPKTRSLSPGRHKLSPRTRSLSAETRILRSETRDRSPDTSILSRVTRNPSPQATDPAPRTPFFAQLPTHPTPTPATLAHPPVSASSGLRTPRRRRREIAHRRLPRKRTSSSRGQGPNVEFLRSGSRRKSLKMMTQLLGEESAPPSTLQIPLPSERIGLLKICLIIDQPPRSPIGGGKRPALLMLREPPFQITRVAKIQPLVRFGLQHLDVKHV